MSESPTVGLLGAYLRPEGRRVAGLAALLVASMLLPLAGPALTGRFIDEAIAGRPLRDLWTVAGAYVVVVLTAEGLQFLVAWASVHLAWRAGNRLREDLARHALGLDLAWHGTVTPGFLIERIDGDVEALAGFFSSVVVQVAGNAVLLAGVVTVVTWIDWRIGAALAIYASVAFGSLVRLREAAVPAVDSEREATANLYGDLEERLAGLEDLRANGAGAYALRRLSALSSVLWRRMRSAALRSTGAYSLAASIFSVGAGLTLAFGILLHREGELSVGTVFVLFRYTQLVRTPLERIAEQLKLFQQAAAGARRAGRLLATVPGLRSGGRRQLPDGPLEVDVDRVTFSYSPDRVALHGVDLHVGSGRVVGVVGRTGSGKTTLARLVLRLWDVDAGAVRLAGIDVREVDTATLRRRTGVVTQDVQLVRATLRSNLTMFGAIAAGDSLLVAALRAVELGRWFDALPAGLDTQLEGSGGLSAGEAQLLAFARVFLADPGLVILDEASSRLDPITSERVAAATVRLLAGRTAIVIAHRLETLDHVDDIAVIDDGRVVEHGTRAALASDPSSHFSRLLAAGRTAFGLLEDPADPGRGPSDARVGPVGDR